MCAPTHSPQTSTVYPVPRVDYESHPRTSVVKIFYLISDNPSFTTLQVTQN